MIYLENKNSYARLNQDVDTSFLTLEMTWAGLREDSIKDQVGSSAPFTWEEIIKGTVINTYIVANEFQPFAEECSNVLLRNSDLLVELKHQTFQVMSDIQNYAKELFPKIDKINKLSNKELIEIFKNSKSLQSDGMYWGILVAFADVFGQITNKLTEIVSEKTSLKYPLHTYTSILGSPRTKSLTEQAYEDLNKRRNEDHDRLLAEYFWLDQGYIGRGLTKQELSKLIKQKEGLQDQPEFAELEKELALSDEETYYFQLSRDIIKIKAMRADSRQFLHVITNRIIDYLAEQLELEPKYLETLSAEEIISVLENKNNLPKNLDKRWQHSLLIPNEVGGYKVILGQAVDEFLNNNLLKENLAKQKELKGQTAQPGKVKGVVKLVLGAQHIQKVKEGDILVSVATSPQLLPAMKKAAAFVTDVGGITSHAAIVSREMNKPCIVGTNNASQVLNDGDKVEVDADKGIVKILKS